ncbi:MAG: undecaprenyl-diphosphate phosphatase [Aestuariivirga sp.]
MIREQIEAALLGLMEGLTEFLPVSSTGHLILLGDFLAFNGPPGRVFEVVIQLGAILAVCWTYRQRLGGVIAGMHRDAEARRFAAAVGIAVLPAMVLGALLHTLIKTYLFNPWTVAGALVVGGIAILAIERKTRMATVSDVSGISSRRALGIGLCQAVAMFPGVSRSGATIMGGLLLGLDRKTATEFSFFLAIPTMLGAAAFDIYKNRGSLTFDGSTLIAIGFLSAFLAAFFTIRLAIGFISRHGFAPFAWYRIALGTLMLGILAAR